MTSLDPARVVWTCNSVPDTCCKITSLLALSPSLIKQWVTAVQLKVMGIFYLELVCGETILISCFWPGSAWFSFWDTRAWHCRRKVTGWCWLLGWRAPTAVFSALPDFAMVLQEFKKSWKPCHSFSFLSSCIYQVKGLAVVHGSVQSLCSLTVSWTAICLQGFARAVTVPVTPELTRDKQENLSLNPRDEVDAVKIKALAT